MAVPTFVELGDGEAAEVQNPIRKSLQSRLSSMGKVRSYGTSSEAETACQSSSAPAADRHGPDPFAVTSAMVLYLQNCPQGQKLRTSCKSSAACTTRSNFLSCDTA